jgi:chromosomal replication initiation ATPase DnaA
MTNLQVNNYRSIANILLTSISIPAGYNFRVNIEREEPATISSEESKAIELQKLICDYFNKTVEEVTRRTRKNEIVIIRYFICKFIKQNTVLPLAKIAGYAGYGIDHTLVLHANKKLKDWLQVDETIKQKHISLKDFIINNSIVSY